jgi:outer membrane biosynthesis protein TonB
MFDAQEVAIAIGVALLAQLLFIATFQLPSPKLVQMDISNDNAQPIAVSITPILKLGSKNPTSVPSQWQRKKSTVPQPTPQPTAALPSPQADKTPQAIPTTHVPDAAAPPPPSAVTSSSAAPPDTAAPADSSAVATASSVQGSEQGAANGTETDPLKGRAADMYRQQLMGWFAARFQIRGKIPFDTLKKLHASTVVTISDRHVTSFSITRPSGDTTFDAEVQATLSRIQSGGAELPAPPPMYPDLLGASLPVGFACNIERACE